MQESCSRIFSIAIVDDLVGAKPHDEWPFSFDPAWSYQSVVP